jgi:threonine/homoserine/homoserine lactone efflux protein
MIEPVNALFFLAAAAVIALTPGPGIMYVAARTLAGGRAEGIASSVGTGLGGFVHVLAGALGVSAVVMASAEAFTVFKLLGAAYLVWLGIKTWRSARVPLALDIGAQATGTRRALGEGIVVEALNPKTAAFFLAFLPQFVEPQAGSVALQFVALGTISVILNTLVDVVVAMLASSVRRGILDRASLVRRLREGSALVFCGLGLSLAFARRPS